MLETITTHNDANQPKEDKENYGQISLENRNKHRAEENQRLQNGQDAIRKHIIEEKRFIKNSKNVWSKLI